METTDTLLKHEEKELLADMIGKQLDSYACDDSVFVPTSFKSVWVTVDGQTYEVNNSFQSLSYFGGTEDIGVIGVHACAASDVRSHLVGQKLAVNKVGRRIEDVLLYEDTHACTREGTELASYAFTAAIVFVLGGTEIVFEKGIPFEEDIDVYRGHGARTKVYAPEEMLEESESPEYSYRASRVIVDLRGRKR